MQKQFKRERVEQLLEKREFESKIDFERRAWSELELEREKWNKMELERRARSKLEMASRGASKTSNVFESKPAVKSRDLPVKRVQSKPKSAVGTENVILQFFQGRSRKKGNFEK